MSDHLDSLAALAITASACAHNHAATIGGAAGAGQLLGILASLSDPADARDYLRMANAYCAIKAERDEPAAYPVAAFTSAFQHQVALAAYVKHLA